MAKLTVAEELHVAIQTAAEQSLDLPSRAVAETFYDAERGLVHHFERGWIIEKLASLIRRYRAKKPKPPDLQMTFLGFRLPRSVALPGGRRTGLLNKSLWDLRQIRAKLWKQKGELVENLDAAIEFLEPHSRENRGVTLARALKLQAEKEGK